LPLTCLTTISLLSIGCIPITNQFFTSAVLAANCECYHKA
jgi:hypothetical protein